MSKRLQVLMSEDELLEIKAIAHHRHMTVAEWVRQSLRAARKTAPPSSIREKLNLIQTLAAHSFPSSPIDQMLKEIESGYLDDTDN